MRSSHIGIKLNPYTNTSSMYQRVDRSRALTVNPDGTISYEYVALDKDGINGGIAVTVNPDGTTSYGYKDCNNSIITTEHFHLDTDEGFNKFVDLIIESSKLDQTDEIKKALHLTR